MLVGRQEGVGQHTAGHAAVDVDDLKLDPGPFEHEARKTLENLQRLAAEFDNHRRRVEREAARHLPPRGSKRSIKEETSNLLR